MVLGCGKSFFRFIRKQYIIISNILFYLILYAASCSIITKLKEETLSTAQNIS